MNRRVSALLLSVFLGSASLSAASARAEDYAITNVPGPSDGVEYGRVEGVLDASTEEVLAILHDYSKYAGLFPYFQTTKVLSQRGGDAIVYLEAKVLHGAATLWGQVRMKATPGQDGTEVIDVKMMKGKANVTEFLARWEITPVDGGERTKVAFQLLVDPDLPVPNALVSNEMKNSVGKAFRALRKRTAERGAVASLSRGVM
ncbi:MAG TPA: SRPBCC family protein [Polyangiales bacterium]|nr:SRPBCC family protein [Polyangiales bacterium]